VARQHRVTIREIARMTGVSTQTVSRVINQRPDVSPATRESVQAAIAAVGFQPSAVARSLVQRRSLTLGVVVAGLKHFGVSQTLNGITEECEGAGYGLLLKELSGFGATEIGPVVEFLAAHRVEGIIFAAPHVGPDGHAVPAQLVPGSPPIVLLKSPPSPAYTTIGVDNHGGAVRATAHLLALGRRVVAHVSGPLEWLESRERRDGWRDALRDAGATPGPSVEGNWLSASGQAAFEQILAAEPGVDAIFAANDQMALGVVSVANRRGIRIPDDIAVVGFDGLAESAHFTPSLTTMRQPLSELGRLAVRKILSSLESDSGPAPAETIRLSTELIVRDSAPQPTA
jgi:DNA-binding LacI/PurR family transcriptional regulator